uniref:Translation initiation factor IF-1, chloroplastic n=1 Tax=Fagus sylvatica TaxID=28930 RepID=A0A2N9H1U0_FAGSY
MLNSLSPSLHLPTLLPQNPTFLHFPLSLPQTHKFPHPLFTKKHPHLVLAKSPNSDRIPPKAEEQKWTHEGSITESLPNGMFRVRLDNQDLILGYISGKIRKNFIRILPGDRVKVEVSRYDSTRGRIIYRGRNPKD